MSCESSPMPWIEAPPVIGDRTVSSFIEVPGLSVGSLINEPETGDQYVSDGWVQSPDGLLQPDEDFGRFRQRFCWQTVNNRGPWDDMRRRYSRFAEQLVNWARTDTFQSFKGALLGVTIEYSSTLWAPPRHTDPEELDTITHLDVVENQKPTVLVLGAINAPSCKRVGEFTYRGDLETGGKDVYRDLAETLPEHPSTPGKMYAADARRGQHGKRPMRKHYLPFRRHFARVFVSQLET